MDYSSSTGDVPTGVLPRVSAVLHAIAHAGEQGVRLVDLAAQTGIARPTVHRLLQDLVAVGFVAQLHDRRYGLGPELFWLGLDAPPALPNLPAVRALAQNLANVSGDTVYVGVRRPEGVRYVIRAEGGYPIRLHLVAVGETKAFTSSYSGLALLGTLPAEAREAALHDIVVDAPEPWGDEQFVENAIRSSIEQVRTRGWCVGPSLIMPGIAGIAAPVPNRDGTPVAAISISAVDTRLSASRAEELAPRLLATAARIGEILSRDQAAGV